MIKNFQFSIFNSQNGDAEIHPLRIVNRTLILAAAIFLLFPMLADAATIAKPPNNLGLVGYWSFNEGTSTKATDFSGRGNTGTLSGTTLPTWVNGKFGKALSFNGSTTYVNTGSNPATQITNAPMTVSAWVKPNNDNGYRRIVSRELHFFLGTESNQLLLGMGDGVGSWNSLLTFGSDATLTNGQWYHVVAVHNGTTARGYVNGVDVGTLTYAFVSNNQSLLIGSTNGGAQAWNGIIDDVRVYNRALSAAEVKTLYTTTK